MEESRGSGRWEGGGGGELSREGRKGSDRRGRRVGGETRRGKRRSE